MDNIKARKDLVELEVKSARWIQDEQEISNAPWILTNEEKEVVKKTIGAIRTPISTMDSLKSAFTSDDKELASLKSHDWFKILQFILPIKMTGLSNPMHDVGSVHDTKAKGKAATKNPLNVMPAAIDTIKASQQRGASASVSASGETLKANNIEDP
ncbi:hypothetical protein L7F22_036038, partial [Adiantum nelumboides]|nr:hypothetical protein [Adiantum nelumboides]